ncbi:antitoxin protein [Cryobacterium sp. LW097]|uniref:Rv0909 family putative TA system antitoxin n=1 Tax=Cryobacterium sp. LW097 TaxID=1978566 RepID=UPI000B4D98F9|nr:Rv0909 family putative TA system antitoxin [Cryobacterium sp. LW097]ASD23159.1 antitoxin protein [Cryobacterium sp. LW097]
MNLNDITRKAQDFLKSDKGEEISDKVIDGAAKAANKVTGDKHADKIQDARDAADKHIGRDDGDSKG